MSSSFRESSIRQCTLRESMFAMISKCQFATDIWLTLEKEFLTKSRAKTLHVKSLLQNTKKDNMSIHDYFLKMKSYAKNLSSSGVVITDPELLNYILDGLDSKYDATIINITTRLESKVDMISIQEAQIVLQKLELRLEKAHTVMNTMIHNEFHSSSANVPSISVDNENKKLQSDQSS
ncbi:uncharacterized protein LOC116133550 [Pistacia vera]|uniref:uncharacterized protein LOC116133550 n=1 Tax=Pistacia vera TaxID=55513 RepID=UPI001263681D|nr:uncharacterized protein LOC116133550 [Pistacia vera]